MGVGGPRWWFVSLSACLLIVHSQALADPAPNTAAPPAVAAPPTVPVAWAMPEDAARQYSPFLNSTLGGMTVGKRFDVGSYLGAELGAFLGPWRVSLRALFPFGVHQATEMTVSNPEFVSVASTKPALVLGAAAGVALYSSTGFVASLSANFMRSDVSDFGNILGVSLPLEWVTKSGLRLGLEPGFLGAFGGEVLAQCEADDPFDPNPVPRDCDQGEVRAFDRDSGSGYWVHILLGIPFDTPEPVPVFTGAGAGH